jgi:dTMP kinase
MSSPLNADSGLLIAFEGLDQSGKQTQAELLRDRLTSDGRAVRLLSFPDYETVIGAEIGRALRGEREYSAEVMQLLYVANRFEWKGEIVRAKEAGTILVCDRYLASSIAYGEAQGLDGAWLGEIQKYLPQPDITFLLEIAPEVSADRKTLNRDKYESDLSLLSRVRDSYLRQASRAGWTRLDAGRDRNAVAADVWKTVAARLMLKET